jgi:hypothetical protein
LQFYNCRSHVFLESSPARYAIPEEGVHSCCESCQDCNECDRCKAGLLEAPWELRDIIALFPNTTTLTIRWEVDDDGIHSLKPTLSGDQLRHLRRLDISLQSDPFGAMYESLQADDARMLLDHFHMPSLESVAINFSVSENGHGYLDDFGKIRDALCGIHQLCCDMLLYLQPCLIGTYLFKKLG